MLDAAIRAELEIRIEPLEAAIKIQREVLDRLREDVDLLNETLADAEASLETLHLALLPGFRRC
jgi:uncharacterized coiled-coil protein SlyX